MGCLSGSRDVVGVELPAPLRTQPELGPVAVPEHAQRGPGLAGPAEDARDADARRAAVRDHDRSTALPDLLSHVVQGADDALRQGVQRLDAGVHVDRAGREPAEILGVALPDLRSGQTLPMSEMP